VVNVSAAGLGASGGVAGVGSVAGNGSRAPTDPVNDIEKYLNIRRQVRAPRVVFLQLKVYLQETAKFGRRIQNLLDNKN
jgi:hypothetical protein